MPQLIAARRVSLGLWEVIKRNICTKDQDAMGMASNKRYEHVDHRYHVIHGNVATQPTKLGFVIMQLNHAGNKQFRYLFTAGYEEMMHTYRLHY